MKGVANGQKNKIYFLRWHSSTRHAGGVSAPHIGQEPTAQPHARPVPAYVQADRVIPPPVPPPTLVDEKNTNPEPDSIPPTGIAFEHQKPNAVSEILTTTEPPRDNPTPEPLPSKNTARVTATEPQMVGTMDGGEVGRSCGDINKMVGTMD